MRMFVSNVTAAMLIVHALVGCCRQHDHSHTASAPSEASDSLAAGCCHHEHGPPSDDGEWPVGPCDCRIECKSLCVSLPPEKAVVDAGQTTLCIDLVAAKSLAATSCASTAHAYRDARRLFCVPEPPLRTHLLHQIIVV